jgi:hypothetical protein
MRLVILSLLLLFVAPVSYADIYKYVDENGVVCYTDAPFNNKAERLHKEHSSPATEKNQFAQRRSDDNSDYRHIVHEKASAYNIDPSLIKAVIKTESNWNSRAISRKGAIGLMQLMPSTASDMNVRNPFDPEENIEGGTKYLKYLLEKFNGDLTLALAAYNAGPKVVEKCGYVPPITETRHYVDKVLSLYNGKMKYASFSSDHLVKGEKKSDPIYKIVLEDGTMLFTNSSLLAKNPARL